VGPDCRGAELSEERFQHWGYRKNYDWRTSSIVRCDYHLIAIYIRSMSKDKHWIPNFPEGKKNTYRSLGAAVRAVNCYRPLDRCSCTPNEILSWEIYLASQGP